MDPIIWVKPSMLGGPRIFYLLIVGTRPIFNTWLAPHY